jgi:hypothetical protein
MINHSRRAARRHGRSVALARGGRHSDSHPNEAPTPRWRSWTRGRPARNRPEPPLTVPGRPWQNAPIGAVGSAARRRAPFVGIGRVISGPFPCRPGLGRNPVMATTHPTAPETATPGAPYVPPVSAEELARRNRAAVALVAGVVGLAVQTRTKAELARSLARETDANRALVVANAELGRSKAAVQARYDLAVDAIRTFHTGVGEDFLLEQDQFKGLRDRLLNSASDFYGKFGALLVGESDVASRRPGPRLFF